MKKPKTRPRWSKVSSRTYGSKGLAVRVWKHTREALGDDHPATLAARGRMRVYTDPDWKPLTLGEFPGGPETTAWARETRWAPGLDNRHQRNGSLRDAEKAAA